MAELRVILAMDRLLQDAYHVEYGRRRYDEEIKADDAIVREALRRVPPAVQAQEG